MGILDNALRGTLPDKRTVSRIVIVVHFSKEPVKDEVPGLFAAGVLLAQMTSHATHLTYLAHIRSAKGIVAENMDRGLGRITRRGHTFTHLPQPMQRRLSTFARPSTMEIACFGHTFAHAP